MSNPEHVEFLRRGEKIWNEWRVKNMSVVPNLSFAELDDLTLSGLDLSGSNLSGSSIEGANFTQTILSDANLSETNLRGGIFKNAKLDRADLSRANLSAADLSGASLVYTNLSRAVLIDTNFFEAVMHGTELGNVDLSSVRGLETVIHTSPSTLGIDTVLRSDGNIPEVFLRGIGIPEEFIHSIRSLVTKPIQYFTCFISYSSKDYPFVERLHADLQTRGVRCWLDREDLQIGDKWRDRIDEAIRMHDKLLLVLSQNSVASEWVEREVETAFEKESRTKKSILFPITLDQTIMEASAVWAGDIRRTRYIGNFINWKNHDAYLKVFNRLLRDLKAGE